MGKNLANNYLANAIPFIYRCNDRMPTAHLHKHLIQICGKQDGAFW